MTCESDLVAGSLDPTWERTSFARAPPYTYSVRVLRALCVTVSLCEKLKRVRDGMGQDDEANLLH